MNTFTNGVILWSPTTGAYPLNKQTWERYSTANLAPIIGLPTSNETATPVAGVTRQNFQRGTIWRSNTGAWEVYGGISFTYTMLGEERSVLGAPTSGETSGFLPRTRMNTFTNGAILWSPTTGAYPVQGDMWKTYSSNTALRTSVGLPVEFSKGAGVTGVAMQKFQNGILYWSAPTGTHALTGRVLDAYLYVGGPKSSLGIPTSSVYPVADGSAADFQKGKIIHNTKNNTFTVVDNVNINQQTPSPTPVTSQSGLKHPRTGQPFPQLVLRWEATVLKVMSDLKVDKKYLPGVLAQIQQESSGIPDVVNNWDSNWEKGYASFGLLQTIAPTYQKYAPPGKSGTITYKDVKGKPQQYIPEMIDPYNNIYAGINYALNRYGISKLEDWNRGDNRAYSKLPE